MTISVAWVRSIGKNHELIVASDSRLTSVGHVDVCQKIFPLARGDSFFAFCGETILAFPIVFQIVSTISNFRKYSDRTEDVTDLLSVILDVINSFRDAWNDTLEEEVSRENKITKFLFGGWSWKLSRFVIFPIQFDNKTKYFHEFTHRKKVKQLGLPAGEVCLAIGNYKPEFLKLLRSEIENTCARKLDYEPLRVLCQMLRDPRYIDRQRVPDFYADASPGLIGGAPQAIKIYKHANVRPLAIRWGDQIKENKITLFGRPLFDHERTLHAIYNPTSNEFLYPLSGIIN